MTKYSVGIKGMIVRAPVGLYDWEKQCGRDLSIDLSLQLEADPATLDDNIETTVNYEELIALIEEKTMLHYNLLETLMFDLSEAILTRYTQVISGRIKISKLHPLKDKIIEASFVEREFCK